MSSHLTYKQTWNLSLVTRVGTQILINISMSGDNNLGLIPSGSSMDALHFFLVKTPSVYL
jgi:hypothetical protein